jgi:hypothetical protein
MPINSTDIIQSFRLRFWRESSHGAYSDWRGDVWHEQQKLDEGAIAVANPDQAFELVRKRLCGVQKDIGEGPASSYAVDIAHQDDRSRKDSPVHPVRRLQLLAESVWRKLRG